ncbi:MAG: large conductance mechanosensitive channel protein MscL [Candidatus Eisenbacteria bacterium]|nr:large conductance mechanosensitive channel protein MscL [Candidatus Eisenbacteria bacterium]MCC7143446.1 large conductance mechanosensitive channel protein MscL [Candidatus Eisenbacteria bacterium]
MLKEFKEFAMKGNVLDMAIGIILGGAFGGIINSLVADVLMPPIGLAMGGVDFSNLFLVLKEGATPGPYASLKGAKEAGAVAVGAGVFLNTIINFLIVAFAMFMLVKGMNAAKKKEAAAPAAPAEPPADVKLLTEIRDLLAKR